jgi:hypothetical protein
MPGNRASTALGGAAGETAGASVEGASAVGASAVGEITGGGKGMAVGTVGTVDVLTGAWVAVTGGFAAVRSPRVSASTNPIRAAMTASANSASPAVRSRLLAPVPPPPGAPMA